jgi:Plavaka transposase
MCPAEQTNCKSPHQRFARYTRSHFVCLISIFNINMPTKKPKQVAAPRFVGPCPNRTCSSHPRIFKNLQKHISQKAECMQFMNELRKSYIAKMGPAAFSGVLSDAQLVCLPVANVFDNAYMNIQDDRFMVDDDASMGEVNIMEPDESYFVNNPVDIEQIQFAQYKANDDYQFLVSPTQAAATTARRVEVTLLKILTELETPLWAFKVIMDWAYDAAQSGYNFMPLQSSYQAQLGTLSRWVGMEHMHPSVVEIPLPGIRADDTIEVTTFDFISQFHSLLSDRELNIPDNLVVNPHNPFTRYIAPDGRLGECLSGSWYNNAWEHMETTTDCNFMIPIILYIDKTKLSLTGKLTLFPVTMSLSIFTEATRRQSRAWRTLGFIANEDYFFSAAERGQNNADIKCERFHRQLEVILKSFFAAQAPGALHDVPVQLGNVVQRVNLYVPLQFIIGDVEGGDQLCSRQTFRREICLRMCRTCDVSTANASRPDLECTRVRVADIKNALISLSPLELNAMRQRPGFNSLYDVDCGGDPYGVFSMIHTEGLHSLEIGIMEYSLEILFNKMNMKQKYQLDCLVKRFVQQPRQHGYKPFPRIMWPDGVTTISNLTGDLKVGKFMAIITTALTLEGQEFFESILPDGLEGWRKMTYVFQQIMCYWMWLKQEKFWFIHDPDGRDNASFAIRKMMEQLQALWPRLDGLGWDITKIHEQFHVPVDIERNGSHKNVHTAPQEHNHVPIKRAAQKTQKNKKTLDYQTGERLMERLVIQRAYDFVTANDSQQKPCKTSSKSPLINASKGYYALSQELSSNEIMVDLHWDRAKYAGLTPLYHDSIIAHFIMQLFEDYSTIDQHGDRHLEIPYFTEYERNGFVYRAHPNYRGNGPYYDWVKVNWEVDTDITTDDVTYSSVIGRILGFFTHPDGETNAIIHSVKEESTGLDEFGVFGHFWQLECEGPVTTPKPILHFVHVDCLLEHVCMLPYTENDEYMWVHMWHPSLWPSCFLGSDDNDHFFQH